MIGDRFVRVAHHAFIILLVLASVIALSAQTVVDPQFVEFTPSSDHNTLASDGTPLVQRYSLSLFVVGSSVAFDTMDLGKPTPTAGVIRVDFLPLRHSVPTPGVVFEARVTAVGPGGSTASTLSNGFSFQGACSPSLNSTGQSVGSGAATGSVGVTAGTGCTWSAVSNAGWVTLSGATSGTGNGTVPYSVAANPSTSPRSGTLTVAGQTYTVTQAALSCTYSVSPTSQSVAASGGTGSTGITAPAGCAWTGVSNNTSWLTVTSGASGSGNGTVAFSAAANPTTGQRSGTLTIGGRTFTVNQAAAACTYSISPTSQSLAAGGGTGSATVTAGAGCAWTGVSNNTSWLTVTSGASGSGGGTVAFSATANPNGTQRGGTLTIAGQTFSVTQAAVPCTYGLSSTSQSVVAGGGTGSTNVTAPTGCSWTGVSNSTPWLTVTAGASGSGTGSVSFSAAANASSSQRSGTLTIGGQTFTVTQAGAPCTYSISPTSQAVVSGSTSGSTNVTAPAGCAWTGVSNSTSWLTVTSGASGSGNGAVGFSASANGSATQRSGTLTIAGRTFTVTQAGVGCTFAISSNSLSAPAAGSTGSTNVTALAGCPWSASSNNSWITVTSGATGSGDGTVGFSVAVNPNASARTGTLTIASQTFTVSQAASACTYSLTPTSQSVTAGGGGGATTLTAPAGCSWTAVSNAATWLSVSGSASGSGNATVNFVATANPNPQARSGTLTIGGQTFTVNQSAASCTITLAPTSRSVVAGGGAGSTAVTAPTGCSWTAVSNNTSWLTVTGGTSGNGSGTVTFNATSNTATQSRAGTVTIAGQTLTVNQDAAGCSFTTSPTTQSVVAAGGTASATVTTTSGCSWTAVSGVPWITTTAGAAKSGSGSVSYSVTPSPSTSQRVGTLTIAGQVVIVTQAANTCSYTITPGNRVLEGAHATGTITVTTASGCAWLATTNQTWVSVSGAGTASGSVSYTVQPNTTGTSRIGAISIGTQVFTISQGTGITSPPAAPRGPRIVAVSGGS